jgi:hypothetical protein
MNARSERRQSIFAVIGCRQACCLVGRQLILSLPFVVDRSRQLQVHQNIATEAISIASRDDQLLLSTTSLLFPRAVFDLKADFRI